MAEPDPRPPHPANPEPRTGAPRPGERPVEPEPVEEFELLPDGPPPGLVRRFVTTQRHFLGLLCGALVDWVRTRHGRQRRGLAFRIAQLLSFFLRPFLDRAIRSKPFPIQLRRRLEILGATYIKLGQVLSLRQDLLPDEITRELSNLQDHLPVMPFPRFRDRVEAELDRPVEQVYSWIDPRPLGSASIAQVHRGRLRSGEQVILKVVKTGLRETLERDARLLWLLGLMLQAVFPRLQPKRVLDEFVEYTLKEVDLIREADNAETFAANFKDHPNVVFPKIYRRASSRNLLTMEFLNGVKPSATMARGMTEAERAKLVDLGGGAIIKMLYQDGFFHADLHPGNLLILPGPKVGFIDLGMVGRFGNELRRTLMYYYFALVSGDAESAGRYLTLVARPGVGADPDGFRREVAEICRRWQRSPGFREFNLGTLILQSLAKGATFRMYFPVELVLMVKAIVTFEGVGQIFQPGFDVKAVSLHHARWVLLQQFSPVRLAQEGLKTAPELVEAMLRSPMLVSEGMRLIEQQTRKPPDSPLGGLRGTVFGGFLILVGVLFCLREPFQTPLFLTGLTSIFFGLVLALRRGG